MFAPRLRHAAALSLCSTLAGPALAGVVTYSGALDDPANTHLVASDLGAALFADALDSANNVALYTLNVAFAGNVSISSTGFALGGIDPYFTLFAGTDPATAMFRASNVVQAQSVGGDFTQSLLLAAGGYTVAIGTYQNLSFAENLGSGVLADGFIGLGGPGFFGDGHYRFSLTLPDSSTGPVPVPEPAGVALVLAAAGAAGWAFRRRPAGTDPLSLTRHQGR